MEEQKTRGRKVPEEEIKETAEVLKKTVAFMESATKNESVRKRVAYALAKQWVKPRDKKEKKEEEDESQ